MKNDSRDKLITDHLEMAAAIAAQCVSQFNLASLLPYSDVLAYAHQGLVEAADRYSPNSDTQFRSFAWVRIRGAVIDGVRKSGRQGFSRWLGLDRQSQAAINATAAASDIEETFQPSHPDALDNVPDQNSLDYSPEADIDHRRLRAAILQAIDALPSLERDVALKHYYRGQDMGEIGKADGRSKFAVVRIHAKCLRQLREALAHIIPGHRAPEVTQ